MLFGKAILCFYALTVVVPIESMTITDTVWRKPCTAASSVAAGRLLYRARYDSIESSTREAIAAVESVQRSMVAYLFGADTSISNDLDRVAVDDSWKRFVVNAIDVYRGYWNALAEASVRLKLMATNYTSPTEDFSIAYRALLTNGQHGLRRIMCDLAVKSHRIGGLSVADIDRIGAVTIDAVKDSAQRDTRDYIELRRLKDVLKAMCNDHRLYDRH